MNRRATHAAVNLKIFHMICQLKVMAASTWRLEKHCLYFKRGLPFVTGAEKSNKLISWSCVYQRVSHKADVILNNKKGLKKCLRKGIKYLLFSFVLKHKHKPMSSILESASRT